MAEQIPYSIAENLLEKLSSVAFEEINLVRGVKTDQKKLKDTLSTVNAVLQDAEEKQQDRTVKSWIRRLKEVVYDADDLFDDIETEELRKKVNGGAKLARKVCDFFSSSNQIAYRVKIGHRIKDIRERLDEVAKDVPIYGLVRKEVGVDMRIKNSWRETDSFVQESEIIGRDGDKEKIVESLLCLDNGEDVSVVAIVGFGGLGKTALAQLVFTDNNVVKHFDPMMWVCVSEEFDVKMIIKNILKCVGKPDVNDLGLDQLQSELRKKIEGKRYLLVLDDVWNENIENWNNLRKYLLAGARGSKILVTTRSIEVASIMGVDSPHTLAHLTEEQSWILFKKLAFKEGHEVSNSKLIAGQEIVKKCKGVPLAVKTLGSMMRSKISESEWLSVLENDVWKLLESKSDIGPVLKLSYDHLSNYSRQCFAFCAMFPKDYEFDKERLIQLWIAQGYIQSWSTQGGNESLEKIGDRYFNELLSRSFFQRDKYCYKMHDLIHDLARSIAGDSCFMANDNANYIPDGVQHLYFEGLPSDECLRQLKYKGLRTLFFSKLPRGLDISFDNVISHCRSLRALSLCESNINKLTNSIGKLKHLRYLEISGNQDIKSLPNCVSSLYNLHTVILRNCQELRELLTNIRKLICLRHLLIDQCHSLECMPVGLGRLTSLQRLPTFIVGTNQRRRCSTLNELNSLNQLRGDISIKGLRHVKSIALESNKVNLKEKKHLRSLNFDWQGMRDSHFRSLILVEDRDSEDIELLLDNLQPHPNLKELSVGYYEGVKISNWLSSIANIFKIDIEWCPKCEHLPRLEHLPSLEYLSLRSFHSLEYISDKKSFSSAASTTTFFPSLKILILRNCPNLKGWWRTWRDAELVPQFPCLSELTIFNCPKLSLMPTFPSLDKKLWLSNANKRPWHQTLNVTATASTLPSMSSFPSSVTTPLSKLQSLILRDVEDLASLPKEWMRNLTSLENLTIRFCKELSDEEDLLSLHGVTKLRCLYIENCSNSTALLDWIGNITSIENLEINDCPNLASLPKGMRQITTLQEMSIAGCPHLSVRCSNHMAADWPNISHIPNIRIDYRYIQKGGRYLLS